MTIGERIKQRRIELNLTQDELAQRCGYKSRSSIQKLESERDIPFKKVTLMAKALETTESYLTGWLEIEETRLQGESDAELLKKINQLTPKNRTVLIATLDALIEGQSSSKPINNP